MTPILYKDIFVESDTKVKFVKIIDIRIEEKLNEHASAYISGVLHEEIAIDEIYSLSLSFNIKIKVLEDHGGGLKEKTRLNI